MLYHVHFRPHLGFRMSRRKNVASTSQLIFEYVWRPQRLHQLVLNLLMRWIMIQITSGLHNLEKNHLGERQSGRWIKWNSPSSRICSIHHSHIVPHPSCLFCSFLQYWLLFGTDVATNSMAGGAEVLDNTGRTMHQTYHKCYKHIIHAFQV